MFARFLFVLLFGAVGSLLGVAFKPRIAAAVEEVRGIVTKAPAR